MEEFLFVVGNFTGDHCREVWLSGPVSSLGIRRLHCVRLLGWILHGLTVRLLSSVRQLRCIRLRLLCECRLKLAIRLWGIVSAGDH